MEGKVGEKRPERSFGRAPGDIHIIKDILKEWKLAEKPLKNIKVYWHTNYK